VNHLLKRLRDSILTGFLVVVPIGVSWWVLVELIGLLESSIRLLPDAIQPETLVGRPIPGLGVLLAFSTLAFAGWSAQSIIGQRLLYGYEWLLAKVPIVSSIHQGLKQLGQSLFATDASHFRQVVLIEYPRPGIWGIAFHTGESFVERGGEPLVNVFLPTTPNPTSGFYLMLPSSDVHLLDLSVEEAFKLIMSAGIVQPNDPRQLTQEQGPEEPDGDPSGQF